MPSATEPPQKSKSLLELLPGKLPLAKIPPNTNLEAAADQVLKSFPHLEKRHFTPDALWRDTYALTGTIRTFYFDEAVASEWSALSNGHGVSSVSLVPGSAKVLSLEGGVEWLDCKFTFHTTTPATECSGMLSLVSSPDGSWKIWVLRTILEQLSNHGNVDSMEPTPVLHNGNGAIGNNSSSIGTSHQDDSQNGDPNYANADQDHHHYGAVIIGGGQSGLSTGGRLQALGVSYVIVEKNAQVGDAWGLRYESARLHTVREYSHLPFDRTFGPEYGEYLGKGELAEGHKKWAEKYGINIWLSTNVTSGSWDEATRTYTLDIVKEGRPMQITTRHVVIATGAGSQTPVFPKISNKNEQESFKGVLLHSADYSTAQAWAGKTGIVVGTGNTAHDVADDMYEAGMDVTMVQRSRTFVLPAEFIKERYDLIYNAQIPTEISDRAMFTPPVSIARMLSSKTFHAMARSQPERYEALERAGFRVDPFGDIQDAINIRLGGHYIDVGTSAKIGKGLIKVKSDAAAERYTEHGLAFSDGTEIKADVIVLATGFVGNLRQHVDKIFGSAIAKRAGDCFGLNSEGEVLGAFKPLEQPGLWYIGGALGHARYYSRFIALSIKADTVGQPLPVYREHMFRIDYICGILRHYCAVTSAFGVRGAEHPEESLNDRRRN
ncbi:dimethylaniline monooxygenase (N-oxide forming) [Fusarium acutatum]|uniref:Dimethylaniline monooxygenase (N-oxide forming) n=1 Tax=Fusarium acutatum TaxID=78861 RepID=A0A8H4NEX0_9HYPO|nr:dimethylaniline monooxygenase (N-oxide forming) [Fusarium acutatum]